MGLRSTLDRLDRTLGRLVSRAAGIVFGLLALGAGGGLVSAVEQREWVAVAVLAPVAALLAAATWALFRPGRRLTDLEP